MSINLILWFRAKDFRLTPGLIFAHPYPLRSHLTSNTSVTSHLGFSKVDGNLKTTWKEIPNGEFF